MPFKVVQTLEGNKFKLFTVPSGWETETILRYPNKCISKFIKDENSTPTREWDVMKCKVKRNNVSSYEIGEKLISEMLKHSDTEDEAQHCTQQRRPQHKKRLNLNSVAQDMMGNVVSSNHIDLASTFAGMKTELNYNASYIEDTQANLTNASHVLLNDNQIPLVEEAVSFDINKMFQNQKNILENQTTIVNQILQIQQLQLDNNAAIISQFQSLNNVQNSLIQKVSALSVQLEDAVSQITLSSNQDVLSLSSNKGHINNIPIHLKPVDNARDLDELEKQLSDPTHRDRLKNTYSFLCSGGKGVDCAYLLVDIMFTRKFICECSWSGGCRGENLKVPLKGYKHVLSFFWNMVHSWDEKFSLKDNEMFFKTILKNAKKRKMAKLERASTSRCSKPKNEAKRVKLTGENSKNKAYDYYDSKNESNEEENAMDYEERNYSVKENTEENKEEDDSVEENMEEKRVKLTGENWKNKTCDYDESENELNEEENAICDEELNDLVEENAVNDSSEQNMKENKERNVTVEENTEENKKSDDLAEQKMEKNKKRNNSAEENTKENKKRDYLVQQKIEITKERNNSVEKNTKENKKRDDLVQHNMGKNKERNKSVQENTKEHKKSDDLAEQKMEKTKERNNSVEKNSKENKKRDDLLQQKMGKNKERNNSLEENTKENKKSDDLVKETTEENAVVGKETSV